MLEDPQKFLTPNFPTFSKKNSKNGLSGICLVPKGTKSWILVNLPLSLQKRQAVLGHPGHNGPPYHESACRCRMVRAMLTKLPDFVPFHICQVPESQFWCLFFKKLKKIDVENFWGSSSIRQKSENFEIFCFFTNKPYFFKLNLNCTCSQLSFEVHNTLETQNFENFEFFYYNIDWNFPPSSD